jgi:hypothetical protein
MFTAFGGSTTQLFLGFHWWKTCVCASIMFAQSKHWGNDAALSGFRLGEGLTVNNRLNLLRLEWNVECLYRWLFQSIKNGRRVLRVYDCTFIDFFRFDAVLYNCTVPQLHSLQQHLKLEL